MDRAASVCLRGRWEGLVAAQRCDRCWRCVRRVQAGVRARLCKAAGSVAIEYLLAGWLTTRVSARGKGEG